MSQDHPAQPLDALWGAAREAARQTLKAATAADKALKAVSTPEAAPQEALTAAGALADARRALEAIDPALIEQLTEALKGARQMWQMGFLKTLKAQAEGEGLRFERLTQDEIRLGQATVILALEKGKATVCYAREPLLEVRADAREIVEGVKQALSDLAGGPFEAEATFDDLAGAYRALVARQGLTPGARVPIVDLIPELLPARQSAAFWKRQDPKKLIPVSRARLAWDLDHLQKARALEQKGARITLGTATGGSAAKKQQVLFLESGPGGGQYYLTFTLKKTGGDHGG